MKAAAADRPTTRYVAVPHTPSVRLSLTSSTEASSTGRKQSKLVEIDDKNDAVWDSEAEQSQTLLKWTGTVITVGQRFNYCPVNTAVSCRPVLLSTNNARCLTRVQ